MAKLLVATTHEIRTFQPSWHNITTYKWLIFRSLAKSCHKIWSASALVSRPSPSAKWAGIAFNQLAVLSPRNSVAQEFTVSKSITDIISTISVISSILYNLFCLLPVGGCSQHHFCVLEAARLVSEPSMRRTSYLGCFWGILHISAAADCRPLLLINIGCAAMENTHIFVLVHTGVSQHTFQHVWVTTAWSSTTPPLLLKRLWP